VFLHRGDVPADGPDVYAAGILSEASQSWPARPAAVLLRTCVVEEEEQRQLLGRRETLRADPSGYLVAL
jgi:hypothetical protein